MAFSGVFGDQQLIGAKSPRRIDEVHGEPVCAVVESMTGARLVHDTPAIGSDRRRDPAPPPILCGGGGGGGGGGPHPPPQPCLAGAPPRRSPAGGRKGGGARTAPQ